MPLFFKALNMVVLPVPRSIFQASVLCVQPWDIVCYFVLMFIFIAELSRLQGTTYGHPSFIFFLSHHFFVACTFLNANDWVTFD